MLSRLPFGLPGFAPSQALHEDPRMLLALLDCAPAGAFTRLNAADGTTPFHLAFQVCVRKGVSHLHTTKDVFMTLRRRH